MRQGKEQCKRLLELVNAEFGINIKYQNREKRNVEIRHCYIVACIHNFDITLLELGAIIDRNHATLIYAQKNHSDRIDPRFGEQTYINTWKKVKKLVPTVEIGTKKLRKDFLTQLRKRRNALSLKCEKLQRKQYTICKRYADLNKLVTSPVNV